MVTVFGIDLGEGFLGVVAGEGPPVEILIFAFGEVGEGVFGVALDPEGGEVDEAFLGGVFVFEEGEPVVGEFGGGGLVEEEVELGLVAGV
ncbi:MAG: hypothetical protein ACI9NQ_000056 [Paracoccaceae bacterium]